MKNLITILAVCFSIAIATAQTKPTKEETFQYIKNEIGESMYAYLFWTSFSMSEMKLNGCELTLKNKVEDRDGKITYSTKTIPMDQIEKIELYINKNSWHNKILRLSTKQIN